MTLSVNYQRKLALIIGINKYSRDRLDYCVHDAEDLNSNLQRIGFDTCLGRECKLKNFHRRIDNFVERIEREDLVLFYFAGHGKQVEDENYLLPSDYDYDYQGHERDYITTYAINTRYLMKKINDRKCSITIYLFDCCRHLIRTRAMNSNQGLLPMVPQLQTLIVFSCAPGQSVLDETRNNRNGSFIEHLLKHILTPDTDIEEIIKNVADDINLQTGGVQLLYRTSSFTKKVCLVTTTSQVTKTNDKTVITITNATVQKSNQTDKRNSSILTRKNERSNNNETNVIHSRNIQMIDTSCKTISVASDPITQLIQSETDDKKGIKTMSTTNRSRVIRRAVEHGVQQVSDIGKGEALASIREQCDHEKQELTQLNDPFSAYRDRVKYLEQTNKQLQNTLDQLGSKWDLDSDRFQTPYEPKLNSLRKQIDLAAKRKANTEFRSKRAEYALSLLKMSVDVADQWKHEDKSQIESLQSTFEKKQKEFEDLQRSMHDSMSDIEKYRKEAQHSSEQITRLTNELDQETMARIKIRNEKQILKEQIPFLSAIHEQRINELRNLSSPNIMEIDSTTFYKNELQRAIRETRNDFEYRSHSQRSELEEYYRVKTEEIGQQTQEENLNQISMFINENEQEIVDLQEDYNHCLPKISQLESKLQTLKRENGEVIDTSEREILELRSRLNDLMTSYDEMVSNKSSLEFELNTYRRLLESEEVRVKNLHQQSSTNIRETTATKMTSHCRSSPPLPAPIIPIQKPIPSIPLTNAINQAKTTIQRSAKGPINIDECSPDGKFIQLANTSSNKDIDLSGWRLLRKVDSSSEITYSLPSNFKLSSGEYVKIHARGQGHKESPYDLVLPTHDSWGVGVSVVTHLLNEQNEEKATHIQKTAYAS